MGVIERELIFLDVDVNNKNELFNFMSRELLKKDYVCDSYEERLKEREESYPTGLKLTTMGVAIPHANTEYSKANKFIVLNLKKQIEFKNMEDESNVNVGLVIGLVFNDKNEHMDNLVRLSVLLQSEEKLKEIKEAGSKEEIYKTLEKVFSDESEESVVF